MPCNCSGSHILGRLQKLSSLQKLQTISKSGLSAYHDHVQNTADSVDTFDSSSALYSTSTQLGGVWSAPSLRFSANEVHSSMPSFPLQGGVIGHQQRSSSSPAKRLHSTAATKASPAFSKTRQLFQDDRQFALEQLHASSPRIAAGASYQTSDSMSSRLSQHSVPEQQHSHSLPSPPAKTYSGNSASSMADSVSSYHGYAGVNYQSGIKNIDAVPNQWGYSLSDYKAVFGEGYVYGCVPWEDQHIDRKDQKDFQKLHSRRVQLLQELHGIEQGIRELMD